MVMTITMALIFIHNNNYDIVIIDVIIIYRCTKVMTYISQKASR